jgi:malate dehydrogenase (oxaloacetate-decarboxylating)
MLAFSRNFDEQTGDDVVEVDLSGMALLDCPIFNKGSAFPDEERAEFGLHGLLPPHVGSLEEQLDRRYRDFSEKRTELQQHVYLRDLQDRNEVLFYSLVREHISEMMPLIYTPVVGEACRFFSRIYRKPRGLFLSAERASELDAILANRPYRDVDVIVVTDGERILGLGDLGLGGMGIPVGKLALYTLCGGIDPARTLPIFLDVGTDNPDALADPLYLGWRHPRLRGPAYDDFIAAFVEAVQRALPRALLQWEDFAFANARRLLDTYRDRLLSFNDDIQGTAAVALAAVIAAGRAAGVRLVEQRVVILGAGSAGTGIAEGIVAAMVADGLTEPVALERIWMVDRHGLLVEGMPGLGPLQRRLARQADEVEGWSRDPEGNLPLAEVLRRTRATTLIGASGQPGSFTEEAIRAMSQHAERPILLPLSNPTSRSEATPTDLIAWTDGHAIVASGSPFDPVSYQGRTIRISQCNNAYIFPGVGQGVVSCRARRVTDAMFLAAARQLAATFAPGSNPDDGLFPPWERIGQVSRKIALAVALEAQRSGLAEIDERFDIVPILTAAWWEPRYPRMKRARA